MTGKKARPEQARARSLKQTLTTEESSADFVQSLHTALSFLCWINADASVVDGFLRAFPESLLLEGVSFEVVVICVIGWTPWSRALQLQDYLRLGCLACWLTNILAGSFIRFPCRQAATVPTASWNNECDAAFAKPDFATITGNFFLGCWTEDSCITKNSTCRTLWNGAPRNRSPISILHIFFRSLWRLVDT